MKCYFVTSEAGPFIRTGGLGDVAAALPVALTKEDCEVRVVLPLYSDIPAKYREQMVFIGSVSVPLGWRSQYAGLFAYMVGNMTYYFIDNEYYFKRSGLYGHFDDGERFAFFSKAVLETLPMTGFCPDVIHVNDWQTGLLPVMLDCYYRHLDFYRNIRTVLAIHNIEFQGKMDPFVIGDVFGLPESHYRVAEYDGCANMLKAGIECASKVVTVSPSYAGEILDPYYAYGLEEILNARRYKLCGILNGIDVDLYDPAKDKALFQNFTLKTVAKKKKNREALQTMVGLPVADKPLIGMVTRLTEQKGMDLIMGVMDEILNMDIQMIVLGTGDWKYENYLREMAGRYPTKLKVIINFSQDIASKIYGGSDMFLMPSKFEPCGLSQMIAMRYGSVPIVRETGGLRDTVIPYNHVDGTGVGFTFKTYNAYDMLDAVRRAVSTYYDPENWEKVRANAMSTDCSWKKSAQEYLELYKNI